MPDIYAHTGDANMRMNNESSWAAARDASTAETIDTTATAYSAGIRELRSSNGISYTVRRYYLAIDTSGIEIKPATAILKIYGYVNNGGQVIAVKVDQSATGDASTDFVASDYGKIDFNTPYSEEYTSAWNLSGYNEIVLNDSARSDMAANDSLKIAVIGHDHDFLNVQPAVGFNRTTGFYPATATSAGNRPLVSWTEGTITPSSSFSNDYTIDTYKIGVLSVQHDKNVDQVPFILGTPGPASLRSRQNAAIVSTGKKKN